jgi:hypothetical protein
MKTLILSIAALTLTAGFALAENPNFGIPDEWLDKGISRTQTANPRPAFGFTGDVMLMQTDRTPTASIGQDGELPKPGSGGCGGRQVGVVSLHCY